MMFQHATPCKFNSQNQDCISCVSLFLSRNMTRTPKPSRDCPNSSSSLGHFLDKGIFWEFWEEWGFLTLSALHPLLSRVSALAGGVGPPQIEANSCVLLPPHPQKLFLHPTALPASRIHKNELNLGELGCPWVLLHWSQCRPCSWDGGDALG